MNTTKKLISLTLAAAMSLSLAACGGGGTSAGSTPPPSGSSTGSGAVQSVADYDIQPELDSSVDYTQGDSYSFIIATDGAEDRVDGLLVHYMADQLNAITGGRIQLQMYPQLLLLVHPVHLSFFQLHFYTGCLLLQSLVDDL